MRTLIVGLDVERKTVWRGHSWEWMQQTWWWRQTAGAAADAMSLKGSGYVLCWFFWFCFTRTRISNDLELVMDPLRYTGGERKEHHLRGLKVEQCLRGRAWLPLRRERRGSEDGWRSGWVCWLKDGNSREQNGNAGKVVGLSAGLGARKCRALRLLQTHLQSLLKKRAPLLRK